ncbi:MAG: CDP-glycerol glycerophosphotransferase family protein [Alishewanella agri]|nr:CDP-glycerol glycerophosphotransferase family protein [Alishewanella agri]
MLSNLKRFIPLNLKKLLKLIKANCFDHFRKIKLNAEMSLKHKKLLEVVKSKEKVKVVFVVVHKSVWKVDTVFKKMLEDSFFEPVILVCPYVAHTPARARQDMMDTVNYFEAKEYSVISSYLENEKRWIKLSEIGPDIIFFTNPHNLTRSEYYEEAYLNYLTCYVPYYTDVATNYDVNNAYNQFFHNAIWRYYLGCELSFNRVLKFQSCKGKNARLVGSPLLEMFSESSSISVDPWLASTLPKKRIIFAPHQSILDTDVISLSCFVLVAEEMKRLAIKYKNHVQWSFKPHPLLKEKLHIHPDWGEDKAEQYYKFWSSSDFSQLDTGEYIDLFLTSDAIIHDCASFVLEYLYTGKPCAFIELNSDRQLSAFNENGLLALDCYERIVNIESIEQFIIDVIEGGKIINENYKRFIGENEIKSSQRKLKPSELIVNDIKGSFYGC